ncbi:hypothetical protein [Polynucleobacter necessarius]|uniref:hypothetical protein n=1 Tax=Polynucleobacter necessarius TaxID=576610 RepID=UPI0018D59002|nr:hypothetical protein [Polynucleobacter necessarius]
MDANSSRVWSVPTNIQKSEWDAQLEKNPVVAESLATTIELSRITGRTAFSKFVILNMPGEPSKEKRTLFWQVASNIVGGEAIGFLAALYTTQGILDIIPGELTALYRFTLLTDDDRVLSISSDRDTPKRAFKFRYGRTESESCSTH